ncbi:MAG: PASTA domain-containing protein, partial [Flavobacteriia bacterium]|nr:PASTA domain-containing protein [Flavobacteriia bacterium]
IKKELPDAAIGNYTDLTELFKQLQIPYQVKEKVTWLSTRTANAKIELSGIKITNNIVPNVVGMTAKDAVFLLESKGLSVRISGMGKVARQSLAPDLEIHAGAVIKLELE